MTSALSRHPFDLIVIGAGINGAGIARDAALRGLRVLLLDKGDVSAGCTGRSTRLVHGGLRYLEHFELALVRESLRERAVLVRIAPHLVHPLPFLLPIYRGQKRGPTLIRAGMLLYDALSFDRPWEHHHMLSRSEALRVEPGLNPEGLTAAARYRDAQMPYPERLTLENVLSARQHGAEVCTYARVDRLLREGNAIEGVMYTDLCAGSQHRVRAPVTVNAAGPWVDTLLERSEKPLIGGTKGSHIVLCPFPGAPAHALYVEARSDRRPFFILPWNGLHLIGTTDIRYDGDLDAVVADETEIEYLLSETNRLIPSASVTREDILYSYAGVRPLPYQPAGAAGAITRRHIVHDHAPELAGLLSIVGGKLTTYRHLAAQTVDVVCRKLGHSLSRPPTDRIPLPGADTADFERFAGEFLRDVRLAERAARRLLCIYGVRATEVLELAHRDPELQAPLAQTEAIGAEVVFSFERELARTLTDVLLRRTMVGLGPETGIGADRAAAGVAVRHLGWDGARAEREIEAYRRYIRRFRPRSLAGAE